MTKPWKLIHVYPNHYVLIDAEDYSKVKRYTWHVKRRGPKITSVVSSRSGQGPLYLHNLIVGSKLHDHKNRNPLDNRKMNLRLATGSQNSANRGANVNNTSGYKGVNFNIGVNRWIARIGYKRKRVHLGCFNCPTIAAMAYDAAAIELFKEFAVTNLLSNPYLEGHPNAITYP